MKRKKLVSFIESVSDAFIKHIYICSLDWHTASHRKDPFKGKPTVHFKWFVTYVLKTGLTEIVSKLYIDIYIIMYIYQV